MIVLLDQLIWRPVIAWAEKFKVEQVESTDAPSSWLLECTAGVECHGATPQEGISSHARAVVVAFCAAASC